MEYLKTSLDKNYVRNLSSLGSGENGGRETKTKRIRYLNQDSNWISSICQSDKTSTLKFNSF